MVLENQTKANEDATSANPMSVMVTIRERNPREAKRRN
jgi:hypothetical protein